MGAPSDRLNELGKLVRERREALGIYAVMDAASRAGLSRETWAKVEAGTSAKPITYRKVEAVLQWEPGSCGAILDGGGPTLVRATKVDRGEADWDELRAAVRRSRQAADDLERLLDNLHP